MLSALRELRTVDLDVLTLRLSEEAASADVGGVVGSSQHGGLRVVYGGDSS